jgi:hypothetical protein
MRILAAAFVVLVASAPPALAQLTETPGPGGIPIAPGAPVQGWTPGGAGIGGGEIAPGPAARSQPMYRTAPGGVPVLVMPQRPAATHPGAGGAGEAGRPCVDCLPDAMRFTIDGGTDAPPPDGPIATMTDLQAALRACWTPPDQPGSARLEMSVRFSFRRSGELMGPPFVTYATSGAKTEARRAWRDAIDAALARCTPLRLSPAFAAGIASRPLSVRFVDRRGG